jgi:FecR protein
MKNYFLAPLTWLAIALLSLAPSAKAQDYSNIRIVRLSFVEGNVQYQRPGESWQDAQMNLPIQEGFALRTGNGYAEVEFENSLAMRLGTNSTVEFTLLALVNGGNITRLNVSQGTAIISAKLSRADMLSVVASGLNVKVPRNGSFRVDASPAESWVTVFHGKVEVDSGSGTTSLLGGGHTLHQDPGTSSAPEIASNPAADDFDKWVSQRETALNSAQNGTSDVLQSRNYTEGFADLYDYGLWSDIPGFGVGWIPYGVGAGWMPFVSGQWMFMGGTGWDWVSSEPWGWLPYHFGGWVNAPGLGWAWVPGGPGTWRPATATWVQVNNQLGWTPTLAPPQSSKLVRSAAAPTVILAAGGAGGVITAGGRVPLVQSASSMRVVSAPAPGFALPAGSARQTIARTSANASTFVQSAPVSQVRAIRGQASLQAPHGMSLQSRSAGVTSMPPSLLAPHSVPAPRAMGGSSGGFRGGFGGGFGGNRGSTGTGTAVSTTRSVSAPANGNSSGSHSGGSMGSSPGHR